MLLVPPRLLRAFNRVATPLAHLFWALTRTRLRAAKCVLVRDAAGTREVLLVRQTYGDRRLWHFPGGLLKHGEAPVDGARRELREETGVDFDAPRELCELDLPVLGHVDRVHYFLCALGKESRELELDAAEIAEARWFLVSDPPRPLGDHVLEVLALLASQTGNPGSPTRG